MTFTVASNSFKDGDYLPSDFILSSDFGFGCAGRNRSPHLKWSGAPEGTKSFAVTCYDPAPAGSGFWHWLLVNIPANVSELAEGAGSTGGKLPAGALQTRTDFGVPGYGGPCPPEGDHPHRYVHRVRGKNRQTRCKGRYISGGRRVQFAFQYAGEGRDHGLV
jgi:Raf kinase inhibitor-like YbhB/YbcL family protein